MWEFILNEILKKIVGAIVWTGFTIDKFLTNVRNVCKIWMSTFIAFPLNTVFYFISVDIPCRKRFAANSVTVRIIWVHFTGLMKRYWFNSEAPIGCKMKFILGPWRHLLRGRFIRWEPYKYFMKFYYVTIGTV